ncbi:MAG: hypothetical protein K2J71_09695 [Oscillospiraceae bacterium]|nr:hypothetical protein [Oscillospiraceae bacterium]
MMKKLHQLSELYYRVILVIFLVYGMILIQTIREFDKTDFPVFSWNDFISGQWGEDLECYLEKHVGFHDDLFQIKNQANLLIGEKMIQNVYVTKQGLMEKFVCDTQPDASFINQCYEKANVPVYFILVPTAAGIYESQLPANAPTSDQERFIKAVYAETESGIRCIDTYHILRSLKEDYIYYRTDSHWTSYGAYYVYQSAIQKMGFAPVPYQRYVISHLNMDFRGDLYRETLYHAVKPDILDCYHYETGAEITEVQAYDQNGQIRIRDSLYDRSVLDSAQQSGDNPDLYRYYLGEPCEKLVIRTNLDNHKKLLLYKDDFADCMIPFLIQHYSEICMIDLQQADTETIMTSAQDPEYTQILFLCSVKTWQNQSS